MKEWDTEASPGRCPSDGAGNAAPPHLFGFDAIGISTAGEVNTNNGTIFYANKYSGYTGMPVRDIIK